MTDPTRDNTPLPCCDICCRGIVDFASENREPIWRTIADAGCELTVCQDCWKVEQERSVDVTPLDHARQVLKDWTRTGGVGDSKPREVVLAESLVHVSMKLDELTGGKFCRLADHVQGMCDCHQISQFIREAM